MKTIHLQKPNYTAGPKGKKIYTEQLNWQKIIQSSKRQFTKKKIQSEIDVTCGGY